MNTHPAPSPPLPPSRLEYHSDARAFVLRPLTIADAPAMYAAARETAPEFRKYSPVPHAPITLHGEALRIARGYAKYYSGEDYSVALFDAAGELLVSAGLYRRTPSRTCLEIGYWTVTRHAGRGYATLASQLLVVLAFEHLGCDRVQVSHDRANEASRRVILRCGFREEGTLRRYFSEPTPEERAGGTAMSRDLVMYGLLSEDRAALPWYASTLAQCRVFDAFGAPVP